MIFPCLEFCAQEIICPPDTVSSAREKVDFTIRLGQGGLQENRSPIDKLGGGQLAVEIKSRMFPIAISISKEYYTNSANPIHSYEIAGMIAVNFLYMTKLQKYERVNFFVGAGMGGLEVPQRRIRS